MNTQYLPLTLLAGAALAAQAPAQAASLDALFVLGDSLSDVGNRLQTDGTVTLPPFALPVPDSPYAYGGGRYSDGPVWVEHLAARHGLTLAPSEIGDGTGYAYGGARTGALPGVADNGIPTLVEQATELVGDYGSLSANALFVVWGGGNDVRAAGVLAAGGNLAGASQVIGAAVGNIATSISLLASHGAERFLVPNLPNLAITPAAIAGGPAVQFGAQMLSSGFNQGLNQAIAGLSAGLGVSIQLLDVLDLANRIVTHPDQFGFTNVTGGCAFANGGLGCGEPDEYAFWDAIHPTAAFHAELALSAVPVPAAVWLFASTVAVFGLCRSRRVHGHPAGAAGDVRVSPL